MKAYLITNVVLGLVGILARFSFLAWKSYPRNVEYTRGEDVFLTILGIVFVVWAAALLAL